MDRPRLACYAARSLAGMPPSEDVGVLRAQPGIEAAPARVRRDGKGRFDDERLGGGARELHVGRLYRTVRRNARDVMHDLAEARMSLS